MTELLRSYGRGLTAVFVGAVLGWAALLILLPQGAMLERALTAPGRSLDSAVAATLVRDAETCATVLAAYLPAEAGAAPAAAGGLAVPSASGMSVPSASGMAVPSAGGMAIPSAGGMGVPSMTGAAAAGAARPYILQCDRADTRAALPSTAGATEYLNDRFGRDRLRVDPALPVAAQIDAARAVQAEAEALFDLMRAQEATLSPWTLANFGTLVQPVLIPLTAEMKAREAAAPWNRAFTLLGLRFERDGEVYQRIGLVTLTRTLGYAMLATALALVLCYPVAYKVALATPPERAVWLFLGLVIPYAIVELMRVYAWTAIIDNQGLLNGLLAWAGLTEEPVQFKRMPGTVFLVIVYTYVLFMVFPIYNVMSTLDRNQIEAARDLGAREWRVHWRVIMPHAKPGIAVGCIATFMLAAGAFSVPRIISAGLQAEWFSQTIYNKFFESENSNVGAAYSFAYTLVCFVIVAVFMALMRARLKDFARVR